MSRKTRLLKPGTFRMIQVVGGSERSNFCLLQGLSRSPDFKPPKYQQALAYPRPPPKKKENLQISSYPRKYKDFSATKNANNAEHTEILHC